MGTRLYPLPGGDGDEKKVWYPLGLGMGMGMNFLCGDGYGIAKPVPAPPRCHPSWNIGCKLGHKLPFLPSKICLLYITKLTKKYTKTLLRSLKRNKLTLKGSWIIEIQNAVKDFYNISFKNNFWEVFTIPHGD